MPSASRPDITVGANGERTGGSIDVVVEEVGIDPGLVVSLKQQRNYVVLAHPIDAEGVQGVRSPLTVGQLIV